MVLKGTDIGRLILEHVSTEKTANLKSTKEVCLEESKKISDGLAKVAAFPYNEKVYQSVQEMMKIASEYLNDLSLSFESAQKKGSDLEKAAEVRVLIDDMLQMGAIDEHDVEEKIAALMAKDSRQLEIVKEAVKMNQGGNDGNVFFEIEKDASVSLDIRKGMFDSVINT